MELVKLLEDHGVAIILSKDLSSRKMAISKSSEAVVDKLVGEGGTLKQILANQPEIVALINGGFFYYQKMDHLYPSIRPKNRLVGDPVGLAKIRENLFGLTPDQKDGLTDQVGRLGSRFGYLVQKNMGEPFEILYHREIRKDPDTNVPDATAYKYLLTCSPVLIDDGHITQLSDIMEEEETKVDKGPAGHLGHLTVPNPRSFIGTREDGSIVLAVFKGRTIDAPGLTFHQLQEHATRLGCVRALNLDGGGSSLAWVKSEGVLIGNDLDRVIGNTIVLFKC